MSRNLGSQHELSPEAKALVAFLDENDYICPWGQWWQDFYDLLPKVQLVKQFDLLSPAKYTGNRECAPGPLVLTGWYITKNIDKYFTMKAQIEWADQHGVINEVDKYLRALDPDCWHKWKDSKYSNGGMD